VARIDPRNAPTLTDEGKLEWLADVTQTEVIIVNSLMQEAEEFFDEDLMAFCKRYLKLGTARGGGRAELTARVAMHDESRRDSVDTRAPPTDAALPKGP
jgi:hypothetical protein